MTIESEFYNLREEAKASLLEIYNFYKSSGNPNKMADIINKISKMLQMHKDQAVLLQYMSITIEIILSGLTIKEKEILYALSKRMATTELHRIFMDARVQQTSKLH